ncbi:hypothetical protein BAE44_0013245 [Dichanthelium oligosanthes]|uniref:Complex III subunit VII n=1 Tax=Dichanthelium oligosanthes TaxID=888268 RepID=A0A1E5VKV1_9POAL|nr:hypothetical protein BAE44_0013245 [Dichanthelium oligosanthes]
MLAKLSAWLVNPRRNPLARVHRNAVASRLRKYGLRYDDLYDPYHDLDIKEALARLPREVVDARNQRLKRAMDLSMKHKYLPDELQALLEEHKVAPSVQLDLKQQPLPHQSNTFVGMKNTVEITHEELKINRRMEPSPVTPMQIMHKAKKKYVVGKVSNQEEVKQRQLNAILNKLTPLNFDKLFKQVEVNIDNVATLSCYNPDEENIEGLCTLMSGAVDLRKNKWQERCKMHKAKKKYVVGKVSDQEEICYQVQMEPTFCGIYATFCSQLDWYIPDISTVTWRTVQKELRVVATTRSSSPSTIENTAPSLSLLSTSSPSSSPPASDPATVTWRTVQKELRVVATTRSSSPSTTENTAPSLSLLSTSSPSSSPPASDEEFSPIEEHDGDGARIDEVLVRTSSSASSSSMKNPPTVGSSDLAYGPFDLGHNRRRTPYPLAIRRRLANPLVSSAIPLAPPLARLCSQPVAPLLRLAFPASCASPPPGVPVLPGPFRTPRPRAADCRPWVSASAAAADPIGGATHLGVPVLLISLCSPGRSPPPAGA